MGQATVTATEAGDRRAALAELAGRVEPAVLADARRLPVLAALEPLLPGGGLRRGASVSVDGAAATSLALALAAGPSQDGAWVAAVGFPTLGLLAAAELGIALDRLVLVADPAAGSSSDQDLWSPVVATLVDAFEVVLVHADHPVPGHVARRLAARCREREAVLVRVGASGPTRARWPDGADVALRVLRATWEGLGAGHGHLQARQAVVEATGRREAARPRRTTLWLPSDAGRVEPVAAAPVSIADWAETAS